MADAILMGSGTPKSPLIHYYVDGGPKEIYGVFTNYTPGGASDPNPIGTNNSHTNYTYLKNYLELDTSNKRINVAKSFKGRAWAWASDALSSRIVLKNDAGMII